VNSCDLATPRLVKATKTTVATTAHAGVIADPPVLPPSGATRAQTKPVTNIAQMMNSVKQQNWLIASHTADVGNRYHAGAQDWDTNSNIERIATS
jgi:hypothetical protein